MDQGELEESLAASQWILRGADDGPGVVVTMAFDDVSRVSGFAGCNTYRSSAAVSGSGGITFGPVMTTRKACEDAVMDVETRFLAALAEVDSAEVVEGPVLVLRGGGIELTFDVFDVTLHLLGTWTITAFRNADAVSSPIDGTDPTITFTDDNRVSMRTGCNTISAQFTGTDDRLTFTAPLQTLMACMEPEGVMEQESALAAALVATSGFRLTPVELSMLNEAGEVTITARRV